MAPARPGSCRPSPRVRTTPVARGDLHVTVSATGTIEPEEVVDVGTQVVGMIREFGQDEKQPGKVIDYGSLVDRGTVLAQIDDTLYRAQRDEALANLQRARADMLELQARLRKTERSWKRAQALARTGVISDADYDVAMADYDTAQSGLAVGDAIVVQAEAALRRRRSISGTRRSSRPSRASSSTAASTSARRWWPASTRRACS